MGIKSTLVIPSVVAISGEGGGYVLPKATAETLGGVKIGNGLSSDAEGIVSVAYATDATVGGVRLVFDPVQGVLNIITQG